VIKVAEPLTTGTGLPNAVAPSWNWTAPVALSGTTVALSSTGTPWGIGTFGKTVSVVVVSAARMGPVTVKRTSSDADGLKTAGSLGVNTAVS
jgi:hypothetical protein